MAETRRYGSCSQLDVPQLLLEAHNRWLRPAEICGILRNYENFCVSPEPPHIPPSGSLFIFDRKVLRYFRKDGYNWRKKKDGKTVREAHERLKAGSVDVLHCYYAHGEENENFQRRSYWMLEEELSHIVLVHYREVKGNRTKFDPSTDTEGGFFISQEIEDKIINSEVHSPASSRSQPNGFQSLSQNTDITNPNSALASEYEDVDSVYDFHSFEKLQLPTIVKTSPSSPVPYFPVSDSILESVSLAEESGKDTAHATLPYEHQKQFDLPSWEDMLKNYNGATQSVPFHSSIFPTQSNRIVITPKQEKVMDDFGKKQEFSSYTQVPSDSVFSSFSRTLLGQKFPSDTNDLKANCDTEKVSCENSQSCLQPHEEGPDLVRGLTLNGKSNFSFATKHVLDHSRESAEALNKNDSFNRWMSKELGDVDDNHVSSNSGAYWDDTVESETGVHDRIPSQIHFESYTLAPSLSQDQLFCIIDFSPNWAYAGCETKILITGKFLKNQATIENCSWSCMFGEVEVPAEVLTHGVLRSRTPLHIPGRVPFYVTCSNRLACSEVREFEFRVDHSDDMDIADAEDASTILLQIRLAKMLTLNHSLCSSTGEISHLNNKISSLLKVDHNEWLEMIKLLSNENLSVDEVQEQLVENILKENLEIWLLQKVNESGKGASVLDEEGQGVLHFAAALGYDWAILPILVAGVSINFRDVNGWTALHWAASCNRERTVVSLISAGAAPGLLTDPTLKYPSGRTPADLASANGNKGISGYLAESAISVYLSSLKLTETSDDISLKAAEEAGEDSSSMKASLAAVCNATQSAARIHESFRIQSFRRKQMIEYDDTGIGIRDERGFSLLKTRKSRFQEESVSAAAIRIQNKFRSWKGRKDFLMARQRIVRIQAHFRGHQVRKNYKKIVWSVGIMEKVILRWRRKGCGLRGFKPEAAEGNDKTEEWASKEDDYEFLRVGRKQAEERLQKALARVKSMAQYPEGRDQYRRLLAVVTEIQETKNRSVGSSESGVVDIDVEALLDDIP